jgi:fructose-1,6-bisphosphatase/inositol monophosphatase family enzyme
LTTYAVLLGVAEQDRAHFAAVTHSHFSEIFSSADITGEQMHAATLAVIKRDSRLAKYAQPV